MIRQIERDDAKIFRHVGIAKHMTVLATVGPCRMTDEKRNPLARFFVIDAVLDTFYGEIEITADNGVKLGHAAAPSERALRIRVVMRLRAGRYAKVSLLLLR